MRTFSLHKPCMNLLFLPQAQYVHRTVDNANLVLYKQEIASSLIYVCTLNPHLFSFALTTTIERNISCQFGQTKLKMCLLFSLLVHISATIPQYPWWASVTSALPSF